jgi:hypothetical protein
MAMSAMLGLCFGPAARAGLTLGLSNIPHTVVSFDGTGSAATFTFTTTGAPAEGFTITNSDSNSQSSVGLAGVLNGSYSFSSITQVSPTEQYALVTTTGGQLVISDGLGNNLTGNVQGIDIDSNSKNGSVNLFGAVNLTGVTYSGTNADLVELKNEANFSGGILGINFTLKNGQNLATLESAAGSPHTYAWAGTIETNSVPEPSSLMLGGIGALGVIGCALRRRKGLGV